MAKIKNCEQLRDYILQNLDLLESNIIDADHMGSVSKAAETVLSSLKMQLAYSAMRQETPNIEFLQKCNEGKLIERKEKKSG